MISASVVKILQPVFLGHYIANARLNGRQATKPVEREKIVTALQHVASTYATAANLNGEEELLLNLVNDVLASELPLSRDPVPRYPMYTNIAIVDRFMGYNSRWPAQQIWDRCRIALSIFVNDWLEFERRTLNRSERAKPDDVTAAGIGFNAEKVRERVAGLEGIASLLWSVNIPPIPSVDRLPAHDHAVDWLYYALEHEGAIALAHYSCMPQSTYHDEYLFLRTIHLTEVCLWATIVGVQVLAQAYQRREFDAMLVPLKEANFFAEFLVRAWSVFRTMPYESFFDGFREPTGNSSAIQSAKYQMQEILTRGITPKKREALKIIPELAWLSNWHPPPAATLPGLLQTLEQDDFELKESIRVELYRLDRGMQSWRNVHLGIVMHYLPEGTIGTGSQSVSYLKEILREPALFDSKAMSAVTAERILSRDPIDVPGLFAPIRIGFVIARNVAASKLKEYADVIGKETENRIKSMTRDNTYGLSRLFNHYKPIFATYTTPFPLDGQLEDALAQGLPAEPIQKLLLALQLSSGLLLGLHDGGQIQFPMRVTTATRGQSFETRKGTIGLTPGELILTDMRKVIASYVRGPDKRTTIQLSGDPNQTFKSVVFLVLGAPSLPESNFEAALTLVKTTAFALSGEPEVIEVVTRRA